MRKSGYMDEDYIKKLAATAGFRFDAESPINNNPKDTKDYPKECGHCPRRSLSVTRIATSIWPSASRIG